MFKAFPFGDSTPSAIRGLNAIPVVKNSGSMIHFAPFFPASFAMFSHATKFACISPTLASNWMATTLTLSFASCCILITLLIKRIFYKKYKYVRSRRQVTWLILGIKVFSFIFGAYKQKE